MLPWFLVWRNVFREGFLCWSLVPSEDSQGTVSSAEPMLDTITESCLSLSKPTWTKSWLVLKTQLVAPGPLLAVPQRERKCLEVASLEQTKRLPCGSFNLMGRKGAWLFSELQPRLYIRA